MTIEWSHRVCFPSFELYSLRRMQSWYTLACLYMLKRDKKPKDVSTRKELAETIFNQASSSTD